MAMSNVLVVDDNEFDQVLLQAHLEAAGFGLEFANNGVEAWEKLKRSPNGFDVVLLDRAMPKMNGLELLTRIKSDPELRVIPVILQTASGDRSQILEGVRAGAYYYLVKPYDSEMLLSVVQTASTDYRFYKQLQKELYAGMQCLTRLHEAMFRVQTVDEARGLAAVLATCCPDPDRVVIGLTELLVNAIEHGNLGISYDEKTRLHASGEWGEEVARRLSLPEHAAKRVEVRFFRDEQHIRFTVRDEGNGFEWSRFLEIDPLRAFDTHGRGIVIARNLSFDELEYRGSGNEVVGTLRLSAKPLQSSIRSSPAAGVEPSPG